MQNKIHETTAPPPPTHTQTHHKHTQTGAVGGSNILKSCCITSFCHIRHMESPRINYLLKNINIYGTKIFTKKIFRSSFSVYSIISGDTEFTCDRKPDGSYPNVEEKSPTCYYMMCVDQEMFCTPCPMHDDKMMFFDSTTKRCVPQKEN